MEIWALGQMVEWVFGVELTGILNKMHGHNGLGRMGPSYRFSNYACKTCLELVMSSLSSAYEKSFTNMISKHC